MVKLDQEWTEVTWQEALEAAARELNGTVAGEGESLGVLVSPNATVEEMFLLRRITEHRRRARARYRRRVGAARRRRPPRTRA